MEAERVQLAARLEDTGRRAEADIQRLSSTLCEEVSALNLQQVSANLQVDSVWDPDPAFQAKYWSGSRVLMTKILKKFVT